MRFDQRRFDRPKILRGFPSKFVKDLGGIGVLVTVQQYPVSDFEKMDMKQMEHTFRTNIFSTLNLTRAALRYARSWSQRLISRDIRVNVVASGPIWTPLSTRDKWIKVHPVTFSRKRRLIASPGKSYTPTAG